MVSTFTTNKNLEQPAHNDYIDTWEIPVNSNSDFIDSAFGGVTNINATGASGTIVLSDDPGSPPSYIPPIISITGVPIGAVNYQFPTGVGGNWTVVSTVAAQSITFSSGGGGTSVVVPTNRRVAITCDGTNVFFSSDTFKSLTVHNDTNGQASLASYNPNAGNAAYAAVYCINDLAHVAGINLFSSNYPTGTINFPDCATIHSQGGLGMNIATTNGSAQPIRFYIDATNIATIDGSGISGPGYVLHADTGAGAYSRWTGFGVQMQVDIGGMTSTNGSGVNVVCVSNGVTLSNGATSWASLSDERYKTDFIPFTSALAKVGTLRAGTGRYITDSETTSRSFLMAQDVQKVLPEAVFEDQHGRLQLAKDDVIPLLVAAINELASELAALKAARA